MGRTPIPMAPPRREPSFVETAKERFVLGCCELEDFEQVVYHAIRVQEIPADLAERVFGSSVPWHSSAVPWSSAVLTTWTISDVQRLKQEWEQRDKTQVLVLDHGMTVAPLDPFDFG